MCLIRFVSDCVIWMQQILGGGWEEGCLFYQQEPAPLDFYAGAHTPLAFLLVCSPRPNLQRNFVKSVTLCHMLFVSVVHVHVCREICWVCNLVQYVICVCSPRPNLQRNLLSLQPCVICYLCPYTMSKFVERFVESVILHHLLLVCEIHVQICRQSCRVCKLVLYVTCVCVFHVHIWRETCWDL